MLTSYLTNLMDLTNFIYINNISILYITEKEILSMDYSLYINKALRPNQISNDVIKVLMSKIINHLKQIFKFFLF